MTYRHPISRIKITKHAQLRLLQRVKSHEGYKNWNQLVRFARYEGRNQYMMTDEEYSWLVQNMKIPYGSTQIRIYNGFAYVFKGNNGHARTLITVIRVDMNRQKKSKIYVGSVRLSVKL